MPVDISCLLETSNRRFEDGETSNRHFEDGRDAACDAAERERETDVGGPDILSVEIEGHNRPLVSVVRTVRKYLFLSSSSLHVFGGGSCCAVFAEFRLRL